MKQLRITALILKNFKACQHREIQDIPNGGLLISARNAQGKSTILDAIAFVLACTTESQKFINNTTKAPVFVSVNIEHAEVVDVLTRTLTPELSENGKVVSTSNTYTINGTPAKQSEYTRHLVELFGTKEYQYLIMPYLCQTYKDARGILLSVAGCPTESEYLKKHNPTLAEKIGSMTFQDFETKTKRIIADLGQTLNAMPARIEECSAMLQEVPETNEEAESAKARLEAIKKELAKTDQENEARSDAYNLRLNEAKELQYQAVIKRTQAQDLVSEANRQANKQVDEAEKLVYDWKRTRTDLSRQLDQIKAELQGSKLFQATKERQLAEALAEIQVLANQCREIMSRTPQSDGNCAVCGKWCADLQAKGLEAAIAANSQELNRTKQKGKEVVARRDQLQAEIEKIKSKIEGLQAMEREVESRLNALGEAPRAPERKVIESTEESLALTKQAEAMEKQAEAIIKNNRIELAHQPVELLTEMQQLNDIIARGTAITQTCTQNEKIKQRIETLRHEESELLTKQLGQKQLLCQLAAFYKDYASEVNGLVNQLFENTGYTVKLFAENLGSERGTPCMIPSINNSVTLSNAENYIFWFVFATRVLAAHHQVVCPTLCDNAELVTDETKFVTKYGQQLFIANADKCDFTIIPMSRPEANK